MPVSIDCPSCKGHLLIPDTLWRQRFVGRVQRMMCKKCRQRVEVDGRGPGSRGSLAGPELVARATRADAAVALVPDASRATSAVAQPSVRSEDAPHEPAQSSTEPKAGDAGQALNARPSARATSRPLMPDLNDPDLWLHLARNVASSEPPPPTSGTMLRKRFAAGRTRWIGISGLAAVAIATAGWLFARSEHDSASSGAPITPAPTPPLAAAPRERDAPPRPNTESAPPARSSDETGAGAAAATAPTPTPMHEGTAPEQAASPPSAPRHDTVKLKQILRWAVHNGQECHKEGRSIGTAELFITFSPSGKVSQAELVGEPIASAPVGRCILDYARAIFLPPYDGPSFTVSRTITLR